jgi:DNA gyrase subunit A
MNVTEKTGSVVAALAVAETDELMLMTDKGQSVRIRVAEIRECGRNTQGVKLMDLKEGERIQDVAIVVADEDEANPAEEGDDVANSDEAVTDSQDGSASEVPPAVEATGDAPESSEPEA